MKTKFKNLLVAGILCGASISAFAFTNNPDKVESTTPTEITAEDDEGLFCRIRNDEGEVIARCTLCNCADLAKAVRK